MSVRSLSALAHPVRLEVFRSLVRISPAARCAGELAADAGIPANTLSFHLKELAHAELVESKREGRSMLYSIRPERVKALLSFLYDDCCQGRPELCQPGVCKALTHSHS